MSVSSPLRRSTRWLRRRLGLSHSRGLVRAEIGGVRRDLVYDLSGLETRATSLRREAAGLTFDLPASETVIARRPGDQTRPLMALSGAPIVRVSIRAETPMTGASVILEVLDAEMKPLGRTWLRLDRNRRDRFIRLPTEARGLEVRLKFQGAGRLAPVDLILVEAPQAAADGLGLPASTEPVADVTAAVVAAIRARHQRRDHEAVIAAQGVAALQTDAINRLAFDSRMELRRFDDALAFHDTWAAAGAEADWTLRRLEALANLDRWNTVEALIRDQVAKSDDAETAEVLAGALAFTGRSPELREAVLDRLATVAPDHLAGRPVALDVANRLLFSPSTPERLAFVERVLSDAALNPAQRQILASQKALADQDAVQQLAALNRALALWSLTPVETDVPNAALAPSHLVGTSASRSAGGPLVSVVMTAFDSAGTIAYALRSLLDQTYGDLEIIVVDDASTDATAGIVRDMAAADPRLTLVTSPHNQGTYAGRNLGLTRARGRWVFNQDSDDWAHPQKVERLVEALQASDAIAVMAQGLRLSPDRGLQARRGFLRPDGTSLLFEREAVIDQLGGYEVVRAGGDGEFQRRLERCFGRDNILELDLPLSIIAASPQSLSRASAWRVDEDSGVFTPARNAYRQAYLRRHEKIARAAHTADRPWRVT